MILETKIPKPELLHVLGDDAFVVNAARVSFHKEVEAMSEQDEKLLDYLARNKHTTPFRHPHLSLRCKAPIFLARQLGKHQISMVWNEVSRRYVTEEPSFYVPEEFHAIPDGSIKQGASKETLDILPSGEFTHDFVVQCCMGSYAAYTSLLEAGVAPEEARMVLPQNMMTEWIWTGSLFAFYNVWKQRTDSHAQLVAQEFAEHLGNMLHEQFPAAMSALMRYRP